MRLLSQKHTLRAFHLLAVCQVTEPLFCQFVGNISLFKQFGHPFVGNISPFEWVGHPFHRNMHLFKRLVQLFVVNMSHSNSLVII